MPQMAPLSWLLLFIFFIASFLLFNMMNFYSYQPSIISNKNKKINSPSMNWKW